MVILDTNVIVDFLEGKDNVVREVRKYAPAELAMTFVNKYELLKYKNRKGLIDALENLFVYQSSDGALEIAADTHRQLRARGITMSDSDLLIFGTAIANDELILTQDRAFKELGSRAVFVI